MSKRSLYGSGYEIATIVGGAGLLEAVPFDSDVEIVPNDTLHILWFAPDACEITAIKLYYQTQPGSAGGTYLFSVTGAGNNLINAATYDLEAIVAATLTSMTLTATAADLVLAEGDKVDLSFVSNNVDLTGTGGYVQILYKGV